VSEPAAPYLSVKAALPRYTPNKNFPTANSSEVRTALSVTSPQCNGTLGKTLNMNANKTVITRKETTQSAG
jgi:uncharacterized protein (UPF0333 family)